MKIAIDETKRRKRIQRHYNQQNNITPQGIRKAIHDITERVKEVVDTEKSPIDVEHMNIEQIEDLIVDLEIQMQEASKDLHFETAALLRDQIVDLKNYFTEDPVKL